MTGIPTTSDGGHPREWSISNRTLILGSGNKPVLAVLTGRDPLLLSPGTVLQFDDPPGELVVTKVRVIVGEGGGTVCAEAEPMPKPMHYRTSAAPDRPAERPGHLPAGAEPATAVESCAPRQWLICGPGTSRLSVGSAAWLRRPGARLRCVQLKWVNCAARSDIRSVGGQAGSQLISNGARRPGGNRWSKNGGHRAGAPAPPPRPRRGGPVRAGPRPVPAVGGGDRGWRPAASRSRPDPRRMPATAPQRSGRRSRSLLRVYGVCPAIRPAGSGAGMQPTW